MSYFPMNERQALEYHRARRDGDVDVIEKAIASIAMHLPDLLPVLGTLLDTNLNRERSPFAQQYEVVRALNFTLCQISENMGVDTGPHRVLLNDSSHSVTTFTEDVVPAVMRFVVQQVKQSDQPEDQG